MPSAWQIHNAKSTSWRSTDALVNLHMNTNVPKPSHLEPKTALVRIRAAAINARDMMVIAHDPIYPGKHMEELSPCADGAGEVEAVGEGSAWKIGERVMLRPNAWDTEQSQPSMEPMRGKGAGDEQGTLRQYAVLKDSHLIKAPAELSFEEVAAMSAAGATAVNSLFFGPVAVEPGMVVLTQGTGGVSCLAIRLASAIGATVISTSSEDSKLEIAKKLGATHVINYRTHEDWAVEVLRLTDGKGVDHVVEVGGMGTIEQSIRSTKQGGLISLVGFLASSEATDIVPSLIYGGKTARGIFGSRKDMSQRLVQIVEQHGIHPMIGKTFEWPDAKEAFRVSMGRLEVGKIVIRV